jgi:hypothetical protein
MSRTDLTASLKYTQRSAFKGIIKNNTSIFKTNLPSLTSAPLLPSFSNYFAFIFFKSFWNLQNLAKMKHICKKSSNQGQEMFKCLLQGGQYKIVRAAGDFLVQILPHAGQTRQQIRPREWANK